MMQLPDTKGTYLLDAFFCCFRSKTCRADGRTDRHAGEGICKQEVAHCAGELLSAFTPASRQISAAVNTAVCKRLNARKRLAASVSFNELAFEGYVYRRTPR